MKRQKALIHQKNREKAWRYIGRFMWSFANIESRINRILHIVFNFDFISSCLVTSRLELIKKVKIADLGLKHQGIDHSKTLHRLMELVTIRNVVAHSWFDPTYAPDCAEDEGILFSYIDQSGQLQVPNPARTRKRKQHKEHLVSTITYSEFDEYHAEAMQLIEILGEVIGSCTPINKGANLDYRISKIVASSDNVIPFPKLPPTA
jgi:hypothetical protein